MRVIILILSVICGTCFAQSPYNLNYDSVKVGLSATSKAGFTGKVWLKNFNGNRAITNGVSGQNGLNPGTNELVAFLNAVFYPSQPPTASLSGGQNLELHSAGTFSATLNWSAGRQSATQPLNTITVAGTPQTFSQPSAPGTVSGTQSVTVTWNSNVSYTNTVTTTDSKTASATTSFNFYPKRYWGRSASATPDNTIILASAGGNQELTTTKAGTFTITASGSNYVYFAYPASFGTLSGITVGGLGVTFNLATVSVTNASGYTQNYYVYTSPSPTAGDVTMITN